MPQQTAQDLAEVHEPITDLFKMNEHALNQVGLVPRDIYEFDKNGFLAGVQVLTDAQVEALLVDLDELMDPNHPRHDLFYEFHLNESGDPDNVLFHALGAWRISEAFHDLLWNPRMTIPASQLLGGKVRFWHDQLFCKPPHHGGVVAWHQDYSYWTRTKPMQHLTCWIALDDTTRENGCVTYVPGSHKWDLLPITGLAGDMDAINKVLNEEQQEAMQNPTPVEVKRGHAIFHHPLAVHGSEKNTSNRPRRAAVVNMFRDGVKSDTDDPLLEGVPPIPKGEKMQGPFFPLIYG